MPNTAIFIQAVRRSHARSSLLLLILVGLLLPAATWAQVTYTGTAAKQNFGSQAIGTPSAATTFSFSVTAGTAVGSIGVVTQGAPNLDFTEATGSTCAAQTYASTGSCTVNVTFNPKFAGLRMGAVVFFSGPGNTGTVLGKSPVYGNGVGPQIGFSPAPLIAIQPIVNGGGLGPSGPVALDGAGDLFIGDWNGLRVIKVPADGGAATAISPTVEGVSLSQPSALAVDGAGDLFIEDYGNNRIVEVPVGGGPATAFDPMVDGVGLQFDYGRTLAGIAVDGAGNLFISDDFNNRLVKVPADGGAATAINPTVEGRGLSTPAGLSVDDVGDLFIADSGNSRVVEVLTGSGAAIAIDPVVNGKGLSEPVSAAVDGAGDLFILDFGGLYTTSHVVEVPAGGGAAIAIDPVVNGADLNEANSLAVDGAGNLFIDDSYNYRVLEVMRSQPLASKFPTATVTGTIDTADGMHTVQVQNIGNEALTLTALSYPVDFSEPIGDAHACSGSTSLSPGLTCDVPVEFTPQNPGALSESVTLTDNTLNRTGAQQSITVSGTGLPPATHFSVTTTASVSAGIPFNVTVTALDSSSDTAIGYNGTVALTSSDSGFVSPATLTLSSGMATATVTLKRTGTQTITAMDTKTSSLAGSGTFQVGATPPGYVFYTGAAASSNFGSQPIGTAGTAIALSFSVSAGTTVGSIGVLTQGAPDLDFTEAAGSTCAAQSYTSAATCTVNVTFNPRAAGLRMGAVVFFAQSNDAGTVLGSVPIYGTGTGAQIAYSPATAIVINPTVNGVGLSYPRGVAVDGVGDLFIADYLNSRVVEVPISGGAAIAIDPMVNGEYLRYPMGVAVDGAGDLFIGDYLNGRVVEVPVGGGAAVAINPIVNGEGLYNPQYMAVDATGDLFITDSLHGGRVVEVPVGGSAAIAIDPVVNGEGLFQPEGVAVDGAGDLFIADYFNRVVEIPVGGAAVAVDTTVNGGGVSRPYGAAVDGTGNLFIADFGNSRVVEIPVGGAAIAIDSTGLANPMGVAVDGAGDLFIGDTWNNRVVEIQRAQPPTLNFPTSTPVGTTDTTDGTQTVQIQNIGNQALTLTALSYPSDFPEATGDANACTGSTSLAPGLLCDLPIEFTPQNPGPLAESVMLTDNALNVTGAHQSIAVTGTGLGPTHFSVTSTATVAAGIPFRVTVSALDSANQVVTSFTGTISFTSSDPSFTNPGPLTLSSGTGQAVVTLASQGTQSVTVTDVSNFALTGSGSFLVNPPPPPLAFSATSLSFGSEALGYSTPSQNVYLTNNTSSAIAIAHIKLTGADTTSFVTSNNCGTSLPAGATCRFGVRFIPTALGPTAAAVTVTDSAPGSPQSVILSGTGISAPAASLSLSATNLSFGTEPGDESTKAQNVTLTNTSSASVYFNRITLGGANASSFVTSNTCGGTVGGILAPGATCRIGVRFVPQAGGLLSASITLTDNTGTSPQIIMLSGTGIGPLVTLSATSIPFGNEPLGYSTDSQNVTLSNSGHLPLNIGSIRLTGANVSSFATSNTCGISLAAGSSCRIGARFVPGGLGAAGANITLTDNAPDSPQTIALSGTGITAPVTTLFLSTNSLAFGNETVGASSATQVVTVTNTSAAATLYFKTIALGGTNASSFVTSNTCNGATGNGLGGSLAPGSQCRIGVRFVPRTAGPLAATITLTDSAADSPQSITLTGTGQ